MKTERKTGSGTMLELWRPPRGAGEPVGCLATTYTFAPELFDEQCLARFLEIESEPNREDLAFLLERENRLGGVYAGVLVDIAQAGVSHSLRWDVVPVRVLRGKQHAKLSLLVWSQHLRVIVASANLTIPGYRSNREVATALEFNPSSCDRPTLEAAIAFLREVLGFAPGANAGSSPELKRARDFLAHVETHTQGWLGAKRPTSVRQQLAFSLPANEGNGHAGRSALDEAIGICRSRGTSPQRAYIASPFFDPAEGRNLATAEVCKRLARGSKRELVFCVPGSRESSECIARIDAPVSLIRTPPKYQCSTQVRLLPATDQDGNQRPWHAKMIAWEGASYSALMIGSSNFTCAGLGIGDRRNIEANLITVVDRITHGREEGKLASIWPEMAHIANPDDAEWLGPKVENDEEEQADTAPLPVGFLTATYRAGQDRRLILRLDPSQLPAAWVIFAGEQSTVELLSSELWAEGGCRALVELGWTPSYAPSRLHVQWGDHEAFMPINVEDQRNLPPPAQLEKMTADDMLEVLAAADPSAAFRIWASRQHSSDLFNPELDSAAPVDLDPLRRHDLRATFLHRVRRRARVLAQLRANLQRPVYGPQALQWRLNGLIGIKPLAERLLHQFLKSDQSADEALLTLADFLIVLVEVQYQVAPGALPKADFDRSYRTFLNDLSGMLREHVTRAPVILSPDVGNFWKRVADRCQN